MRVLSLFPSHDRDPKENEKLFRSFLPSCRVEGEMMKKIKFEGSDKKNFWKLFQSKKKIPLSLSARGKSLSRQRVGRSYFFMNLNYILKHLNERVLLIYSASIFFFYFSRHLRHLPVESSSSGALMGAA
jgi:hypothetical protein